MSASAKDRYVREILESYRRTPGTRGRIRTADRRLAEDLFHKGVPIHHVRAALLIAAGRRTFRDPDLGPLQPIASLHYFLPVIGEVQSHPVDADYLDHIETRLRAGERNHRSP